MRPCMGSNFSKSPQSYEVQKGCLFLITHTIPPACQHAALLLGMPFESELGRSPMSNEKGFSLSWISLSLTTSSKKWGHCSFPKSFPGWHQMDASKSLAAFISEWLTLPRARLWVWDSAQPQCLLCVFTQHSKLQADSKDVFKLCGLLLSTL